MTSICMLGTISIIVHVSILANFEILLNFCTGFSKANESILISISMLAQRNNEANWSYYGDIISQKPHLALAC